MKKTAVIGVYGVGADFTTGQAVKCFEIINWLSDKYGRDEVRVVNTYQWKKNPVKLFRNMVQAFRGCDNVILMPAQHGLRVFGPWGYWLKKIFKTRVHYVVIGGWLSETLSEKPSLRKCVASFDGIYVETKELAGKLRSLGLTKVHYMPNFRSFSGKLPVRPQVWEETIPVCTYSRVVREKGILDAMEIVKRANRMYGKPLFHLDIYGKLQPEFKSEFESALEKNRETVRYCGVKNADQGPETLAGYFALLFPTFYEGEGFAGTILDAFAGGTPVIANDWKYNKEIIENKKNGFLYPFRDLDAAARYLCQLYGDKALYLEIQRGCMESAEAYSTDAVLGEFEKNLK